MSNCKSYSHFFSKKFQHICISLDVNFNESLTNDVVSFEQLGPGVFTDSTFFVSAISGVHIDLQAIMVKPPVSETVSYFLINSLIVPSSFIFRTFFSISRISFSVAKPQ